MREDYRDMVIETLADAEVDALDSAGTWREIARAAIGKLHEQRVEIERLREQHYRVLDQYRALRARTASEEAA